MAYANGRTLSLQYDNRLRATRWDVPGVMGWNYSYNHFNENTGRVTYAQNLYDATLDRAYDYDNVGRLIEARTASEARGMLVGQGGTQDGPYAHSYRYDQRGNMWYRVGWGGSHGAWLEEWPTFTNNRRNGLSYDAAGNLIGDGTQTFSYDATGQQTYASGTALTQSYDGDGLRANKTENSATTYYLRSTVLGGQVVAEMNGSGAWTRGFVYLGGQTIAIQSNGANWVHQDPVTKSQRVTDSSGNVTSVVDLDPWGGETSRSSNQAFQPHRYTTYERDANGGDEAMFRRYQPTSNRFNQPDPYDGSYNLTDPQSLNRYAYVQNDPVNFVDPSGLDGKPGDLCPGGVIGNDGKCYEGPVVTVTVRPGPSWRDLPIDNDWGGFQPLPVVSNPRGGLPGPIPQPHPQPTPSTGSPEGSYATKVAGCYARCLTQNRLDNVIRDAGNATGHPRIGEFAASLTVTGAVAAVGNQALNLTPLGRYPRGGVGGASRAGMPTSWQHRVGGSLGRAIRTPAVGSIARGLGRGANSIGQGVLAFEGGYWQGVQTACAVACTNNPSCF